MRKRLFMLTMAVIVGFSTLPMTEISAKKSADYEEDDDDYYDDDDYDNDDEESCELTKGDIIVTPAKKTIKVGSSFSLGLYPSAEIDEEYADLPDEEWEELLNENIDGITYRSTRSSVAYVSKTGRIKGKKKGSAIIKTTISFSDGSEGTYKTKVYVIR